MRALPVAPFLLVLAACGGTVVFEEAGGSDGGGPSTSQAASQATGSGTGSGAGSGGSGPGVTTSAAIGAGGAAPDGSCIAADYCACVAIGTCQVVAEDCFCPCDEPCVEPCDCGCGGGAFLQCLPGSIRDPGALDVGVWLVGWSGGLNHFSWLRFEPDGSLRVLGAADVVGNEPYFPCSGSGTWSFGDDEQVHLELPAGCAPTTLTFGDGFPSGLVPGALQELILIDAGVGVTLGAWRFPDEACTPDLTSCIDPFAP